MYRWTLRTLTYWLLIVVPSSTSSNTYDWSKHKRYQAGELRSSFGMMDLAVSTVGKKDAAHWVPINDDAHRVRSSSILRYSDIAGIHVTVIR